MDIFSHHLTKKIEREEQEKLKPKKRKNKNPEKQFQDFLVSFLRGKGHIVVVTYQKKVVFHSGGGKTYTNQSYEVGTFDLIVCNQYTNEYFEIDCKSKTGVPTDSQLKRIEKYKHLKSRFHFISEKNYIEKLKELKLID